MLEGKEFVGFISLRLHQGTVKGMKLDTEQSFAAQNPSTENIMILLHKYIGINGNYFYKDLFPYKRN